MLVAFARLVFVFFFFNDTATTEIYTLSLHDALPIGRCRRLTMADTAEPTASRLPRWRGFNLQEKFKPETNGRFREEDFAFIARHGFDFVRLPLDYRLWTDEADPYAFKEPVLAEIDEAIEFGQRHAIHVSLCFHRAPGYCVNPPREPLDLWRGEEAQRLCARHWAHFAERYRG